MTTVSEALAKRIRPLVTLLPDITEKKMFGGIGFMLNGNLMVAAMSKGLLMVRVGREAYEDVKRQEGVEPLRQGTREMTGYVAVSGEALESEESLLVWIDMAHSQTIGLPAK